MANQSLVLGPNDGQAARGTDLIAEIARAKAAEALALPKTNIDTDSAFTANSDTVVPSQKAVKTALAAFNTALVDSTTITTNGTVAAALNIRTLISTLSHNVTVQLPASPANGARYGFFNVHSNVGTYTWTFDGNGNKFYGSDGPATLTGADQGDTVIVQWDDGSNGNGVASWIVTSQSFGLAPRTVYAALNGQLTTEAIARAAIAQDYTHSFLLAGV